MTTRGRPKITRDYLYLAEVAGILGLSIPRVKQLEVGPYPLPKNDAGQFPLRAFGDWFRQRVIREHRLDAEQQPDDKPRTLRDEKDTQAARKDAALAEKTELENAVRRGELCEASEVIEGWQNILARVRTRMLQIPSIASPLVVGETDQHAIRETLDSYVRDALLELSAPDEESDDADEE